MPRAAEGGGVRPCRREGHGTDGDVVATGGERLRAGDGGVRPIAGSRSTEQPQKIKRVREDREAAEQSALAEAPRGKRSFGEDDRAAQVLVPSVLSISTSVYVGESNAGALFPEIEGVGVIRNIQQEINLSPVRSIGNNRLEAQDSLGQEINGELTEQIGSTLYQNNEQNEKSTGILGLNKMTPTKTYKRRGACKGGTNHNEKSQFGDRIALVNEEDFITVPLEYHESFDISTLIGTPGQAVSVLPKPGGGEVRPRSRIRSRPVTKADIDRIPSPLKEGGSNTLSVQQLRSRKYIVSREVPSNAGGLQEDETDMGTPVVNFDLDPEDELDYSSE